MYCPGKCVGKIIGYQIGLDRCANKDTCILYMTAGIAMNKMINELEPPMTHLIIGKILIKHKIILCNKITKKITMLIKTLRL